jgi:dynein heavy chain
VEEGFLEFVNNMLTTGMVPALFEPDERDAFINSVRSDVKREGILDTAENCWQFFINRCRDRLHIVLAMSPSGDKLRLRCRNFPGLVSNCVIDWFFPWPSDALESVASFFLRSEERLPEEHLDAIIQHFVFAHTNVTTYASQFCEELRRHYYVTPKNYLDFIANYKTQVRENEHKIDTSVRRLEGGLTKLIEASEAVDRMQADLTEKKVIVDEKTIIVEVFIKEIEEKSAIANQQ